MLQRKQKALTQEQTDNKKIKKSNSKSELVTWFGSKNVERITKAASNSTCKAQTKLTAYTQTDEISIQLIRIPKKIHTIREATRNIIINI